MGENWQSYDDWSRDMVGPFGVTFFIVASYLEGIGVLVRRGLISVDLVNDILGGITVMFWNKIGDYIREHRAKAGYPGFGHDLEYLYEEVMKLKPVGFAPRTSLGLRTHTDSGDDI